MAHDAPLSATSLSTTSRYLRFPLAVDHRTPLQDGSSCPHCRAVRVQKWGRFAGRQRYRCGDCGRTFSTFTGTALHYLKRSERWTHFLWCVDGRLTVRAAAVHLGVNKDTALRWRHRLLEQWRRESRPRLKGRIVIGDFCMPHSAKGARFPPPQRPPRRRGEPWTFASAQTGPVTVLVAWERPRAMIIESVGARRLVSGDYDERLAPRLRDVEEIVGCRGPACGLAAFSHRVGARYRAEIRSFFPREVFLVRRQLRAWLRPFRGVATRRLDNYLEWFRRRGPPHVPNNSHGHRRRVEVGRPHGWSRGNLSPSGGEVDRRFPWR